mgnify:CR=1 FL=1
MTSNLFTRRAMLSSGALLGLGTLLAACGQQAANEASASASTAPSETATAAASEVVSESATPSPRVTRGYSGQSKAPDGEYRKADGYGPAQNVPKPRNEPAQYPENEGGLNSMIEDWVVAHNYAIQTGDCSYAKKYVTESTEEYRFYEYLEGLYQRGGWVIEGLDSYRQVDTPIYDETQKMYRMKVRVFWSIAMYIKPDGKITKQANTNTDDDTFNFFYSYSDGYWKIVGSGEGNVPDSNEDNDE